MSNLYTSPPPHPLVAPSILSADFAAMGDECRNVLDEGGDLLHLDVMDGHFVPNLTMGPDMCRALRRALPRAFLDVHLMVTDPLRYARSFIEAGANHLTFHVEIGPADRVDHVAGEIRAAGVTVGLAINPGTPLERVRSHLHLVDLVLVMSVHPGFSGQSFIWDVLDKTRALRALLRQDQRLQMDGGINTSNADKVRQAGCDVLVAASAIFGVDRARRGDVMRSLRGAHGDIPETPAAEPRN